MPRNCLLLFVKNSSAANVETASTFLAALGSGLMAGTFFAFLMLVMGALGRLPPDHGLAAKKSINVVVLDPMFLVVFVGAALVRAGLGVMSMQPCRGPVEPTKLIPLFPGVFQPTSEALLRGLDGSPA